MNTAKIKTFLCIISAVLMSSCSTTSYLTQTATAVPEKPLVAAHKEVKPLAAIKLSLERPEIEYLDYDSINRVLAIQELEENVFVSQVDLIVGELLNEAESYIGTPYRFGGTTRSGIDCSAFMQRIYEKEGILLPRVSVSQSEIGIPVDRNELQKGDLIFFSTTSRYRVTHVGMVYDVKDDGEVYFIHASSSQGVTVSSLDNKYWTRRYRKARRLHEFATPQWVKNTSIPNSDI